MALKEISNVPWTILVFIILKDWTFNNEIIEQLNDFIIAFYPEDSLLSFYIIK
jgi:hypothetical protein